jgi:hypothetical protein
MQLTVVKLLVSLMLTWVPDAVCQFIHPPSATTDNPVDISGIEVAIGTRIDIHWSFPSSFLQANNNFTLRVYQGPVNGHWECNILIGT